jgi:hypothetical protein
MLNQSLTMLPIILVMLSACHPARYGVNRPSQPMAAPAPEPVAPEPPKETVVSFGTEGVFHLGDAIFGGSTCKPKLEALPLNGTKFHFKFDVANDDTPIDITISDLCGVDLVNNTIEIYSDIPVFAPTPIPLQVDSMQIPTLTLKSGSYTLTILSGKNEDNPNFIIGNYDDLIVGMVQIKGVNITSGGYSAE